MSYGTLGTIPQRSLPCVSDLDPGQYDDDFESALIAIIGELEDARDYCREGMAEKARKAAAEALDMLGVAMGPDA